MTDRSAAPSPPPAPPDPVRVVGAVLLAVPCLLLVDRVALLLLG